MGSPAAVALSVFKKPVMSIEAIPPPFVITADDKRGLVVVITVTTLSFIWTCLLMRIWVRLKSREWRSDDYFLAAATIVGTVQSGLVLDLTHDGLGRSQENLSPAELRHIGKDEFGSQILYIFTLLLSKSAALLLYLRLSPRKEHHVASWATLGASAIWALGSTVLIAVPCSPVDFWLGGPERCPDIYTKWQAISALDIFTEAAIFLISIYLVAMLNMKTKSKVVVVAAFSARLPVIAISAIRLVYLRETFSSSDRTLAGSYYIVCTQGQLGYAIMSSTITGLGPFLRPFSKSFSTSYRRSSYSLNPSMQDLSQGSRNRSKSNASLGESYQLGPIKAPKRSRMSLNGNGRNGHGDHSGTIPTQTTSKNEHLPSELSLRPDMASHRRNTAISRGDYPIDEENPVSRWSDESGHMIITKTTSLQVESGRRSAGL